LTRGANLIPDQLVLLCSDCKAVLASIDGVLHCDRHGPRTQPGEATSGGRMPRLIDYTHPRYDEVFGGGGIPTIGDDITEAEFHDCIGLDRR
jgi:hypothetical protein